MVGEVRITKNGILAFRWDGEARRHVTCNFATALHLLRWPCRIEPDVTLEDVFRAVERDHKLMQFLEVFSDCDIAAFHREARRATNQQSDLAYIEIAKRFEWRKRGARQTIHLTCTGESADRGATRYGLDFIPVNNLVHLPVRLSERIEIWQGRKKLGEAPAAFTLLEVLGEIYWEIGFYGNPESRDREAAELFGRVRGTK